MSEPNTILADELKFDLDDYHSGGYYEKIVTQYQHTFLREMKMKVLLQEGVKNRGAYFNRLVQSNGGKYRIR